MTEVFVAIYEHCHGDDVSVFLDEVDAWAWRTAIAKEQWRRATAAPPPSDSAIGASYFEFMADHSEYFSVHRCGLTGARAPRESLANAAMKVRVTLTFTLETDAGEPITDRAAYEHAAHDAELAIRARLLGAGFLPDDALLGGYDIVAGVADSSSSSV